ncbi:hypothetical protein OJ963_40920 [Streptomyces sp. RS2]|nr:hypothetical protein [Streptomyces sp. RS2]
MLACWFGVDRSTITRTIGASGTARAAAWSSAVRAGRVSTTSRAWWAIVTFSGRVDAGSVEAGCANARRAGGARCRSGNRRRGRVGRTAGDEDAVRCSGCCLGLSDK